ncbi:hypothetical protein ACFDR9_001787 [Janthinobacterium sp. CG_23.3]|uniref:hypothetical protein n=1 Tax=Janthinobacterium sp. CG_23.3 TaxID=3349634 RepID=UPI0038D50DFF
MSNTTTPHTLQLAQANTNPVAQANTNPVAQANTDPGFKVPGAGAGAAPASAPADAGGAGASAIEVAPLAGAPATDTSSRELAIGGGVFLVLLLIFFFVRNAFANNLVRRRVAPSSAESAGWLLFVGLSFLGAAVVLAIINASKFLTFAITGTLMLVGLAALVGAMLAGRR